MIVSASSEFVALCREQLTLLGTGLGASLSVVYLTQELAEVPPRKGEAELIPVAVYPETAVVGQEHQIALPFVNRYLLSPSSEVISSQSKDAFSSQTQQNNQGNQEYLMDRDQIVLPLIHDSVMMGLLVTTREDRAWKESERTQVENVAQSLAIACIMDRRRAWLASQTASTSNNARKAVRFDGQLITSISQSVNSFTNFWETPNKAIATKGCK